MTKILLATNNRDKVSEMQELLQLPDLQLVTPAEVGVAAEFDVPETGQTFAENAELKARAYAEKTQLPTLADDSGLVVAALGGEPGVHSKRFVDGTDHDRNLAVLQRLVGQSDRSAAFVTVLCFYDPKTDQAQFFDGLVDGAIADTERGTAGFGYDPLFIPVGYDQTFGELGGSFKNQLSHRARAAAKFKEFLQAQS